MSESEELLNSLPDEEYSAGAGGTERHIVIGKDRYITVPEELKNIAVQYDKDVETVTFDCPAYWDEHELSSMTVYVNYIRADGKGSKKVCSKPVIDSENPEIMHFTWTISEYLTMVAGPVVFLVCIKKVDEDGVEQVCWHSHLNKDMYVSEGIECGYADLTQPERDIITDLLLRMEKAESVLDMSWVNATDETLEELENGKVNRSGDTITGDLQVNSALTTPNAVTAPEKSTVEDGYLTRQTAKGADIVDGAITKVKTIKGKTVKTTNLIPYPYAHTTRTVGGITFTDNGDGSITLDGTSTDNAEFIFNYISCRNFKPGDSYVYSFEGGKAGSIIPVTALCSASQKWIKNLDSNNVIIEQAHVDNDYYVRPAVYVYAGQTFTNFKVRPMLNKGIEALPYMPYFEGLKHAYIKSIKSTNTDGSKEDTYELDEAVELGEWDEIDVTNGKVIKKGVTVELIGDENWYEYPPSQEAKQDGYFIAQYVLSDGLASIGADDTDCRVVSTDYEYYKYGYANPYSGNCIAVNSGGSGIYIKTNVVSTMDEWKAYLAQRNTEGNPVVIEYIASEVQSVTEIDIPKCYTAYDKGTETIIQGDIDNSQYGAIPTVVQEYSLMVNPKETATKEFVLNAIAKKPDRDTVKDAITAKNAENAANVTKTINNVAITDIFEPDGKKVKEATEADIANIAVSVKSASSETTYTMDVVDNEQYNELKNDDNFVPDCIYVTEEHLYLHTMTFLVGALDPRLSDSLRYYRFSISYTSNNSEVPTSLALANKYVYSPGKRSFRVPVVEWLNDDYTEFKTLYNYHISFERESGEESAKVILHEFPGDGSLSCTVGSVSVNVDTPVLIE